MSLIIKLAINNPADAGTNELDDIVVLLVLIGISLE